MHAPHAAPSTEPFRSVLFPTDLRKDGLPAFAHALRLALDGAGKLTVMHVGPGSDPPWERFPGIRDTLARWGVLTPAATRRDLTALGLKARKVTLNGGNATKGILQRARKTDVDLLVLATHRRAGLRRWMKPSVAESVARSARSTSLVVPCRQGGFVDGQRGTVELVRVLVPAASHPAPEVTLAAVARLVRTLGVEAGRVRVLYVGDRADHDLPEGWPAGWVVEHVRRDGSVVDEIVKECTAWDAQLVAMATQGHDDALDQLRGSTTERVMRRIEVPVLVVPGPL